MWGQEGQSGGQPGPDHYTDQEGRPGAQGGKGIHPTNEGEPFCIGFISLHSVKCSIIINVLNLWYIVFIDVGSVCYLYVYI